MRYEISYTGMDGLYRTETHVGNDASKNFFITFLEERGAHGITVSKESNFCRICAEEPAQRGLCQRCRSRHVILDARLSAVLKVADEISVDFYEIERVVFAGPGVPCAHIDMANEGEVFFDDQMIELCIGDETSTASFLDMEGEEHVLIVNMLVRKPVMPEDCGQHHAEQETLKQCGGMRNE